MVEGEEILYVKGSGWDLVSIKAEGFAPVKMAVLLEMAKMKNLSDTEMVSGQKIRLDLPEEGEILTLPEIEPMSERDFVEWLYFVPEADEIFPFLAEEGILPWENWRDFLPKDGELPNWDELLPNIDSPLNGDNPLNGGGLPDLPN